ncbi:MAG: terpene cyclase/mutase family protein [Planctomycetota bacterium]|nr:terpene cyclase/mutase family protein [Planctomycetota bacterium]
MTENETAEKPVEENALDAGLPADGPQPFLYAVTSQTPWWIVSILLHALIITLAGLMSMTIELPDADCPPLTVSVFEPAKTVLMPVPERKTEALQVLAEGVRATQTDPNGPLATHSVIIPEDVLRLAELSNEFETVDPDKPDRHSASGTPEGEVFLLHGNREPPGGGSSGIGTRGEGMQDVIGLGGQYSPGKNGNGFGEVDGDGVGNGKGNFRGTFSLRPDGSGRHLRIARQRGSRPDNERSVKEALQWLAYHQEPDGHWDAQKYGASVKTDTAATGFALLAFLGAGHTEKVGEHTGSVQRAVKWLKSRQAADGCIWDTTDDGAHHRKLGYPGAIATLAMAEAAGMANIRDTKEAAQKAVDYCAQVHQSGEGYEKGGWRYAPKEEGDLSVTGWFIMALKSAKVAGLKVPASAFDGAIKFLDRVEIRDNAGGSAYGSASRYKYMANNEHANTAYRLTAIGNLARQFLGWKKEELQSSVEWFVSKGGAPSYGANGESVDLYYWYYGTMCVFQQQDDALWKRWNAEMKKALIQNQCKQGDEAGSWNPVGEFSGEWGRVGQTALSALCLEVYYRYDLVQK